MRADAPFYTLDSETRLGSSGSRIGDYGGGPLTKTRNYVVPVSITIGFSFR